MNRRLLQLVAFLLLAFPVTAQIVDIPDANFKFTLLNRIVSDTDGDGVPDSVVDTNGDGEIQLSEAEAVTYLDVGGYAIFDLEGINSFSNLVELNADSNNLMSLQIEDLEFLERLLARSCLIEDITLSNLPSLRGLNLAGNEISELDLTSFPELYFVNVNANNLISLNVTGLDQINGLLVRENELTELDLSGLTSLRYIWVEFNPLTELDLAAVPALRIYSGGETNIDVLDFSLNPEFTSLQLLNTDVSQINIKNGAGITFFDFSGGTNLEYVCVDDFEAEQIILGLAGAGVTEASVNSYCSFEPGGEVYRVMGETRFDVDIDGCSDLDPIVPFMRYDVSNGTTTGTFFADVSGQYEIPLNAGDYELTPNLEYSDYFTIDPSELMFNFPSATSPILQDYCVTAAGDFNDLEVVIIPLTQAVPGFESEYGLFIKNNGTTSLSGEIELTFEEPFMDYMSSDISPLSIDDGLISWEFTDLQPFNTSRVNVTFELNTPTDTPPLEAGEVLNFEAVLVFTGTDETPVDNRSELSQRVVNSFDPNDKTALEGDKILEESVGEYMHYLIRFENLGTANATNVVVADTIDTSKYQLSSLIPLSGSHDFVTRINNNVAEFIFEDIDLPFDDANNDGYILFKIRTQETLELGDSFSNSAAIYFDFNAPIITNEATTTVVSTLSTDEFESGLGLTIYPNPASELLNIAGLESLEIQSLEVYNLQGQLILTQQENTTSIDVSVLRSGMYFIKIISPEGTVFKRFLKN